MKIMTIVNNSHKEFVFNQIESLVEYFSTRGFSLTTEIRDDATEEVIEIYFKDGENVDKVKRLLDYYIANILYGVLIEEFINKKLSKHLNEAYNFLNHSDLAKIKECSGKVLKEEMAVDDTMIYCMNRKNKMLQKIMECIEEGCSINVRGFLDFRFKELREDIFKSIEKIVEKYMIEKEYNEFISLLKYFVEVQESKLDKVDIFVGSKEGEYILKDQFGNDMMQGLVNELCENKNIFEISKDDLVISGLITTCPKKIVIHGAKKSKNKELLNTIEKVFEDRVEFCNGCSECGILKDFIQIPVDSNIKV